MTEQRSSSANHPSGAQAVLRMANAFHGSQAIHVAAELGLADLLAGGPLDAAALAAAAQVDAPALYRLMRVLVSAGVFSQDEQGRFGLTEVGAALRTNQSSAVRDAVRFLTSEWIWRAWGEFGYSVRTGKPAFDRVWGMSNFEYWEHNGEAGRIHDAGMAGITSQQIPAIVAAFDYGRFKTIVDVGGGLGSLLAALLKAYPAARGILFDLPHVVKDAPDTFSRAGVAERCTIQAGSFFETAPVGGDAYLLKFILHDWDDARSLAILKVIRQAMPQDGILLVIDQVLPDKIVSSPGTEDQYRRDLQMLVQTPGGRERTPEQFRRLLAAAGLELTRILPTQSVLSIVEAAVAH